ncbi:carbohydrate ABC transporter substrate-binding protein [Puniceicoccales bacterium CK1056]|uniref:Carbohydrate ABC transporter substrate-binding protein n=1 Tax=Oceanipulchritudo coccoides TaxID=2706888 RepID=A0A6B2M263_9BACT|nr:ABC transporter substrate-binding protein [Oceanipulchritudo coccoides]NDV63091.1 carbohydrate ABC transporter substrate-binding protein [Oceanipulchritudo coccoides]
MPRLLLERLREQIPIGLLVILVLAGVSSVYVLFRPQKDTEGRVMWTFVRERPEIYQEIIAGMGLEGEDDMRVELVEFSALQRRLQSGFFSGTPLADIVEVERTMSSATWRGPLEAVGFVDLTERLRKDGLLERINRPSFSPFTNRGKIFGLPADVHPILLCYRADIFEEAGIDVNELDTWDKFFEATAILAKDFDGDGSMDQYPFELQETEGSVITALMLQAGPGFFDENGRPILDNLANIGVLAKLGNWASSPNKLTGDCDLYTGAGNRLRSEGFVLSWIVPDWRSIQMEQYIPSLAGKLKLMPLPAWKPGGRRTSCWGGTMLGFPKSAGNFDKNWEFAKRLYLSRELAVQVWRKVGVLTPVKELWDDPVFEEPNAYYSNQRKGRLFIDQAENVPVRSSSPFQPLVLREVGNALSILIRYANERQIDDPEQLMEEATELLRTAQQNVELQMNRSVFLTSVEGAE